MPGRGLEARGDSLDYGVTYCQDFDGMSALSAWGVRIAEAQITMKGKLTSCATGRASEFLFRHLVGNHEYDNAHFRRRRS